MLALPYCLYYFDAKTLVFWHFEFKARVRGHVGLDLLVLENLVCMQSCMLLRVSFSFLFFFFSSHLVLEHRDMSWFETHTSEQASKQAAAELGRTTLRIALHYIAFARKTETLA